MNAPARRTATAAAGGSAKWFSNSVGTHRDTTVDLVEPNLRLNAAEWGTVKCVF
jgi:hypothetical protein